MGIGQPGLIVDRVVGHVIVDMSQTLELKKKKKVIELICAAYDMCIFILIIVCLKLEHFSCLH